MLISIYTQPLDTLSSLFERILMKMGMYIKHMRDEVMEFGLLINARVYLDLPGFW
jgi:hypothetical protein